MIQRYLLALGMSLCVATSPAAAHGDERHGAKPGKSASKDPMPWGIEGDADDVTATIDVRMDDTMRFEPERLTVRIGQTVRFVVRNDGKAMHEMVIGTKAALDEHAALMRRHPNMEHAEPYMAHVAPGGEAEIVWKFNRPGTFDFGCLVPGHYESGMVGRIDVVED